MSKGLWWQTCAGLHYFFPRVQEAAPYRNWYIWHAEPTKFQSVDAGHWVIHKVTAAHKGRLEDRSVLLAKKICKNCERVQADEWQRCQEYCEEYFAAESGESEDETKTPNDDAHASDVFGDYGSRVVNFTKYVYDLVSHSGIRSCNADNWCLLCLFVLLWEKARWCVKRNRKGRHNFDEAAKREQNTSELRECT